MNDLSSGAVGIGLATVADDGTVLDTWFPAPQLTDGDGNSGTTRLDSSVVDDPQLARAAHHDSRRGVDVVVVRTAIGDLGQAPVDVHDVYLRLHLLSHRLVRPRSINLDGIFGLLPTVVWTTAGPCLAQDFELCRLRFRADHQILGVIGLDKFPRMTDYVIPGGVRIADADRVRLGAHLAPGTTVMHEGFCNYNAGTLGTAMVEGRISAGVIVDEGTDIGGGASIMGTLSGGGKEVISVGRHCLIGANAGIGISLGDDCVVEAGCYVTAGSLVSLPDGTVAKARELSGTDGLLFRRHSLSGALEALPRRGTWGGLNASLHVTP